jgi:hypothetical protein
MLGNLRKKMVRRLIQEQCSLWARSRLPRAGAYPAVQRLIAHHSRGRVDLSFAVRADVTAAAGNVSNARYTSKWLQETRLADCNRLVYLA